MTENTKGETETKNMKAEPPIIHNFRLEEKNAEMLSLAKLMHCYWCNYITTNLEQIKGHIKLHTRAIKPKSHHCTECQTVYSSQIEMEQHNRIHITNEPFGCNICPKKYSTGDDLEVHFETHADQMPFQCKICLNEFDEIAKLKEHIKNHQIELSFECKTCQIQFATQSDLTKHEESHYLPYQSRTDPSVNEFECRLCQQRFMTQFDLNEHRKARCDSIKCRECGKPSSAFSSAFEFAAHELEHDGKPPFKCYLCIKQYSIRSELMKHMKFHTGIGLLTCDVCEKKFLSNSKLKKHQQVHQEKTEKDGQRISREKTFLCHLCGQAFDNDPNLKRHAETHKKVPRCEYCNTQCLTKKEFNRHIQVKHSDKLICTVCTKFYSTIDGLAEHMKDHANGMEFQCDYDGCNRSFSSRKLRTNHKRVHKRFLCDYCSHESIGRQSLKIHMRTHTGEKPFACIDCEKRFNTSTSLKQHIRVHTNERPYKCVECSVTFKQLPALNRHKLTHTGEQPFQCQVCPKKFSQKSNLKTHMDRVHLKTF